MGKEAVPFAKEAIARAFLIDHRGSRLLRFSGMTPAIVKGIKQGILRSQ